MTAPAAAANASPSAGKDRTGFMPDAPAVAASGPVGKMANRASTTSRVPRARAVDASRAGAAPRGTGSGLPGRHWGGTRQGLLLDVKEALVDEFVDAEGA